jgi:uncharacterized protein
MNSTGAAAAATRPSRIGIAPAWHTGVVLLSLLGLSCIGARVDWPAAIGARGRAFVYLVTILVEWTIVAFIAWGLRRRGSRLSELVGGSWARPVQVLRDLGLGIAFVLLCGGLLQGLTALLKVDPPQSMLAMLPQTTSELMLWVLMSMTAGFCEEVIFRGYLLRQFAALTRSVPGGIVLQALAFGLGHGYQGWKLMLLIAIYGSCFGLFAHWRRSLRPGMLAHALQDTAGGLLARFLGR